MNMNLLAVVTQPYIMVAPPGRRSGRKISQDRKFSLGEFSVVNMKNCGHYNVRKHRDIKGSDKYVTLDILLKFDSLDKMRITSSESKAKLGRSGKGLITSLSLKAKTRTKNIKKQGIPLEMSLRRIFQILFGSLKNYLMKVRKRRGPNMSVLKGTFT